MITGSNKIAQDNLTQLTSAIRAIAHGDANEPGGLEALAMSVAGQAPGEPLSAAIRDGLHEIAGAIGDLADAVRESRA